MTSLPDGTWAPQDWLGQAGAIGPQPAGVGGPGPTAAFMNST